jgi:hypothetical protein
VPARKGLLQLGAFVVTFLGFCGVVSFFYPDKPSVPRTFPDGLDKELGGSNALLVSLTLMLIESFPLTNPDIRPARLAKTPGNFNSSICK